MNAVAMLVVAGIGICFLAVPVSHDHERVAFWMVVFAVACFILAAGLGIAK